MKQQRLPNVANVDEPQRRRMRTTRLVLMHQGEPVIVGPETTINRLAASLQAKGFRVVTQWHPGMLVR